MERNKRKTKLTKLVASIENKRPIRYQVNKVAERAVNIELKVESTDIPFTCFNFWKKGKLDISFKEEQFKSIFMTVSIGSSLFGKSSCNVKKSRIFEKDRDMELSVRLEYTDDDWHVHKQSKNVDFEEEQQLVTFDIAEKLETVSFNISFKKTMPDVRFQKSPALCKEEIDFIKNRMTIIKQTLPTSENLPEKKVPNIAIIGSGGGMRAVIGMGAALNQLEEGHILNYAMYIAGLSGSAWFLLTLYAYDDTNKSDSDDKNTEPGDKTLKIAVVNKHIQTKLQNKLRIYFWMAWKMLAYYIKSKTYKHGEYYGFTNLFGEMIGDLLLEKKCRKTLSELALKLEDGQNPLPLVSALHVQDEKTMKEYNEWVEFSPYQVYLPCYGAAIKMNRFGDKFHRGFCTQKYKEQPIHFLQGICGSAYTIVRNYRPQGNEWYIPRIFLDRRYISHSNIWSLFNKLDSAFVAKVPNFLYGVSKFKDISEDSVLNPFDEFNRCEKITKMIKNSKSTDATERIGHKPWSEIKNWIWNSFKVVTRIALNVIAVNLRYEPLLRADEVQNDEKMMLVDAGIAFNSPYPSVLHPSRKVDVIISFDFSDRGTDADLPFEELKKAEQWARNKGIPFPELYPKLHKMEEKWNDGDQQEVYIFPGSQSPTIVHFVMINKSFRLEKDSISENFGEILKHVDMEEIVHDLRRGLVISANEKRHIEEYHSQDDRQNALLEVMIKRRDLALKQLVMTLQKT